MIAVLVVAMFAVVQSLFGIGLLMFGTPTLLLLGYPFSQTLAILLPASIVVSLLQVSDMPRRFDGLLPRLAGWCLIPIALTLASVLAWDRHVSLNLPVAVLLMLFVVVRLFPRLRAVASQWVSGHERLWLVFMGIAHGLSNLGGGLLMIFAGSRYRHKEDIRALVAHCYVCIMAVQLLVLAVFTPAVFGASQLGYMAVAALVFLVVGRRVFRWVSAPAFDWLLTLFAASYAGLLGLRAAGLI